MEPGLSLPSVRLKLIRTAGTQLAAIHLFVYVGECFNGTTSNVVLAALVRLLL
jgi:hypothetical protein